MMLEFTALALPKTPKPQTPKTPFYCLKLIMGSCLIKKEFENTDNVAGITFLLMFQRSPETALNSCM
jgi:hypothetical protein